MKSLFEYIQINEDTKKDRLLNCKTIGDKVYKAIQRFHYGVFVASLSTLEANKWYIPSGELPGRDWEPYYAWERRIDDLKHKNPKNNKPMGVFVDRSTCTNLSVNSQYKGEDTSESIAACLEILFDILDETIGTPAKKRIEYKDLVKEIRKEYLKLYNEIPCPPDPEERKRMRDAMMNLHGAFPTMPNGTYSMGYDK